LILIIFLWIQKINEEWLINWKDNNIFKNGSIRIIISSSGFTAKVYQIVALYNKKFGNHPIILLHFPEEINHDLLRINNYKKDVDLLTENDLEKIFEDLPTYSFDCPSEFKKREKETNYIKDSDYWKNKKRKTFQDDDYFLPEETVMAKNYLDDYQSQT